MTSAIFRKDESLNRLADLINVAQFVSFAPGDAKQQYARVLGYDANQQFISVQEAVEKLIQRSPESSLNVRSFTPQDPRSNEFLYGLTRVDEVVNAVSRISQRGMFVIVNETVDVKDGGVSGVVQGGAVEFSPDDTPRCVEKPGVASFPADWGMRMLSTVYGFPINIENDPSVRLEFSIHPKPRGWKNTHVLGWELEVVDVASIHATNIWPNNFSRLIGDKAFGLLLADQLGLPVPRTTVVSRRIAPFSFGSQTTSNELWIRTCPKEQVPGKFTTNKGWLDPFQLLAKEDPDGSEIASVLSQDAVPSQFSGALIVDARGEIIVEGKRGEGEILMKGIALPETLPRPVVRAVKELYERARKLLGPVRFEWVYDGKKVWLVQLHIGATLSHVSVLVPGTPKSWKAFNVSEGLEALRERLAALAADEGISLVGQVGLTSHIADIVRKVGKPARIG